MEYAQGRPVVTVGDGGWLRVRDQDSGVLAFVRVDTGPDGRLYPAELHVQADGDLHAAVASGGRALRGLDLRTFPLAAVEADANGPLRKKILERLHNTTAAVYKKPDGAIVNRPVGPGRRAGRGEPPLDEAVLRVDVPSTRPYPEPFWAAVAAAYTIASRTRRPAALIAEHNAVPVRTVQRWVAEARQRGHLPPGSKGKAG